MTDKIDVTKLKFSSHVFPTAEDAELWNSLTPEQQREYVQHDLRQAQNSGIASQDEVRSFFDSILKRDRAVQA